MKKIHWQYFIDPVSTELAQHLAQTAIEHQALNANIQETSIYYKRKKIPVYNVGEGFFNLIYKGRKSYFKVYGHNLRFFKQEGSDGLIHLLNHQELKSAAKRLTNKAIKIVSANKKTIANYKG